MTGSISKIKDLFPFYTDLFKAAGVVVIDTNGLIFLIEYGFLPASQHGFLNGRCTDTAIFEFFVNFHISMEGKSKIHGISFMI